MRLGKSLIILTLACGLLAFASAAWADQMGGMDPNMPGMTSDSNQTQSAGNEGVNWYVVGGFLIINALTVGTAGVLKFTRKVPKAV